MSSSPIYTEVDPYYQWVPGKEFDTLFVDVSGFKKGELKAQVDASKNLKISGERRIEGNQWCRFLKSFALPIDCDARMIKAKFDDGILFVEVPKPTAKDDLPQPSNGHANSERGGKETAEDSPAQAVAPPKPVAKDHLPPPSNGRANNEQGDKERREKDSLAQAVAHDNVLVPETTKQGMEDVAKGLERRRHLIVNFVVVAIAAFIGLGTYIAYKLRSLKETHNECKCH